MNAYLKTASTDHTHYHDWGGNSPSSNQSSIVDSRENIEAARTRFQNAAVGGNEVNTDQTKADYTSTLDNHIIALELNNTKLQAELDTAANNRNISHVDSVATAIRANDTELAKTRNTRAALNTSPTPVAPTTTEPTQTTAPTTTVPSAIGLESPPTGTTVPQPEPVLGDAAQPVGGEIGAAGLGAALPSFSNVTTGTHSTAANSALGILENLSAGKPAFDPELGKRGLVQWFVTEGNPRTGGGTPDAIIPIEVQVPRGSTVLEFNDAQLKEIYDDILPAAEELITNQYAKKYPNRILTSSGSLNDIAHNTRKIAERDMWTEVGKRVAASEDGIGRVVQSGGSQFSPNQPGTFMLTSRPEVATVKGGPSALLEVINRNGIPAESSVVEAAEQAARNGNIRGRIEGVFRVGGRVLVVAGAAADGYRIYRADDKLRETAKVAGGWTGATTAVGAYNLATGPTNAAGPVAWGVNLVGNVVAGIGGYYAGETLAEYAYDLVVDQNPIDVPTQ